MGTWVCILKGSSGRHIEYKNKIYKHMWHNKLCLEFGLTLVGKNQLRLCVFQYLKFKLQSTIFVLEE